jgi:hypothetical protein
MQSIANISEKTEPNQADIDLVVRQIGGGRSREEVCRLLCMQRGYDWGNAQAMVAQVSAQQGAQIARRQMPFLLLLGGITLLGGIVLLIGTSYGFLHYGQFHSIRQLRYLVAGFGLGVMMTLGSAIGLVQAFIAMWK